jgi:PiT family inorganic phosphate transporter
LLDYTLILITGGACAIGFYLAWSIGANDVSNAMATAVGARAITYKQAALIAGVLIFFGAVFVGPHVTETIKSKIIDINVINNSLVLLLGFISSLLAAAIWSSLATWKEMPISTTHSIIGAMIGFGIVAGGFNSVNWFEVERVAASWVLSPFSGCILSFIVFRIIVRLIFVRSNPVKSTKIVGPFIIGITFFIITTSLLLKTELGNKIGIAEFENTFIVSIVVSVIAIFLSMFFLRKIETKSINDYDTVENIFRRLQVITSCYVAFSIGANDVANAIGPVAAIIPLANNQGLDSTTEIPIFLLIIGGVGMAFGCLTFGYKVMKTMGERITKLTNSRGFAVDFGVATTVLFASKLGLPISTSHTAVGAIIGVGLARGLDAVDLKVIKKIINSWLLTLPIAAFTSSVIFIVMKIILKI